jgi:hypothetical protein
LSIPAIIHNLGRVDRFCRAGNDPAVSGIRLIGKTATPAKRSLCFSRTRLLYPGFPASYGKDVYPGWPVDSQQRSRLLA